MTLTILFAAGAENFAAYQAPLRAALQAEGLDATLSTEAPAADVDYIVYAPSSTLRDFAPFTRCKAVLSLWAGVERIVDNPTLTQPLARMVDPGLTAGMVEYVCGHVLRYHLGMDAHIGAKPGAWDPVAPPLATERGVGILGLGELGRACATALVALGFRVSGWSARPRQMADISCHHGPVGLSALLGDAEILVTLLPQTPDTDSILNAETLAQMPRGARIINPGRGSLIDDTALLAALDQGQIAQATLDVFLEEPLPREHPYWHHPGVTITPHIAASTRASGAARVIAQNVARSESGKPLLYLVDRARGY